MPELSPSLQSESQHVSPVTLRSSTCSVSNQSQSTSVRRRSLNVSHFNAVQTAVSKLARIDDFELEELGGGFFSDVFKATHKQTGKIMALKRNKHTNSKMNILREVQLMNRLCHPNILRFKGVCVHEGQLHALTEYLNGGDLDQLITKKKDELSWKQKIQIALDVAQGILYLHKTGIFHRDLSSKNCLIGVTTDRTGKKKYKAVVADLGLAEKIPTSPEDEKRLAIVGTAYIMAPEVLKGRPYNEKADVFSYGLLLCQLIADVSYDPEELPRSPDFGLAREAFTKMVAEQSLGDGATRDPPPDDLLQLAFDCCSLDSKSRPSFTEIHSRLESLLRSVKKTKRASSFRVGDDARKRFSSTADASNRYQDDEKDVNERRRRHRQSRSRRESSSVSRLSRSFSDISRELLQHAANMFRASATSEADASFVNPFSALEHFKDGKLKLIDEPSSEVMRMTFDIATSDSFKRSWADGTNSLKRRKNRPKSVVSMAANVFQLDGPCPPTSLNLSSPVHSCARKRGSSAASSSTSSSVDATTPHGADSELQKAVRRSLILSPRGNNLASWWCARKRADVADVTERHSLATMMSVLLRNVDSVRRCISLPDVSRISSLFSNRENSGFEGSLFHSSPRRPRFGTEGDVFYAAREKDSIPEEVDPSSTLLLSSKPQSRPDPCCSKIQDGCVSRPTAQNANAESSQFSDASSSGCSCPGVVVGSTRGQEATDKPGSLTASLEVGEENRSLNNNNNAAAERDDAGQGGAVTRAASGAHPKLTNRDSGYEDSASEPNALHSVQASANLAISHPVWGIAEADAIPGPSSRKQTVAYGSCGLGAGPGLSDWNSNDHSSIYKSYSVPPDTVL